MNAFISRRLVSPLLPFVLALFCVPPAAFGQGGTSTASLAGKIVDDTGARLPGVTVTVTHLGTNQSRTVISNEEGLYRFAGLQPGNYSFSAELQGFARAWPPRRSGRRAETRRGCR